LLVRSAAAAAADAAAADDDGDDDDDAIQSHPPFTVCRLDVYIYDYLVKRNLQATAKAFIAEGKVATDPVAIDAPGGFLFEWWSIFWDIFHSSTAKPTAASSSASGAPPPPHHDVRTHRPCRHHTLLLIN
jgi:hypothetical protein